MMAVPSLATWPHRMPGRERLLRAPNGRSGAPQWDVWQTDVGGVVDMRHPQRAARSGSSLPSSAAGDAGHDWLRHVSRADATGNDNVAPPVAAATTTTPMHPSNVAPMANHHRPSRCCGISPCSRRTRFR